MDYSSKLTFLENIFGKSKFSNGTKEAEFYCPLCFHKKKKLSINIETDFFQCWICNQSGRNLYYLIKKIGTGADVFEYCKKYKAKNVVIKNDHEFKDFLLKLPDDYLPLYENQNKLFAQRAIKYLNKRGIEEEDIFRYKFGVSDSFRHQNRVILPSFNREGDVNFYTARLLDKSSTFKYYNPDTPRGYKNTIILNELYVDWSKPVVIVEGFFDALKAGRNAIPLCGSSLSKQSLLFQNIVKRNCVVYLALDADAVDKSIKMANNFMGYDISVHNIDVAPFKDCGEMSKQDFVSRYENASLVDDRYLYKYRLKEICKN